MGRLSLHREEIKAIKFLLKEIDILSIEKLWSSSLLPISEAVDRYHCQALHQSPLTRERNWVRTRVKRRTDCMIISVTTDNDFPRVRQKFGKNFNVLKVAFTALATGSIFSMGVQYCACDQRNYYTNWSRNELAGLDRVLNLRLGPDTFMVTNQENTNLYHLKKAWHVQFTRARMWGPFLSLAWSAPNLSVL